MPTPRFLVVPVLAACLLTMNPASALQRATPGMTDALEGRNAAAEDHFAACLATNPEDYRCAIPLAALREVRGDYDGALIVLLRALQSPAKDPLAAGAVARVLYLSARSSDGGARAQELLSRVVAGEHPAASAELRSLSVLALADVLSRQEKAAESLECLKQAGRLDSWTLLGPYGQIAPLAMDRVFAPETGDLEPADDELRPGRRRALRIDTRFADGRIIFPSSLIANGAVYAVTDLLVEGLVPLRLRAASSSSFRVFLDGQPVLSADRYRQRPPLALAATIELGPGRHRLMIKSVGAGQIAPVSVTLSAPDGGTRSERVRALTPEGSPEGHATAQRSAEALDESAIRSAGRDPVEILAGSWWLKARGRDRDLGTLLRRANSAYPDAAIFAVALGEFYFKAETGAAPEADLALARSLLEQSVAADPELNRAQLLLAEMSLAAGQQDEARRRAQAALDRDPGNSDALLLLHRIAARRGWEVEARTLIEESLAASPGRSDILGTAIDFYRSTDGSARLESLLAQQTRRYPQQQGWADLLSAEGRTDEALAAWDAMLALRETNAYAWLGKSRVLTDSGRLEEALRVLDQAAELFPEESWVLHDRAGILALLGRDTEANKALEKSLELAPDRFVLRKVLNRRGQEVDLLSRWLSDARRVLDEDHPRPGTDSALLADIAATLVDRKGGQSELYQGVHAVYTRAGVEHEGELVILPGSIIDAIRIHKRDRRVVDVNAGTRRPVSLPGLEVGDAIEYVTRRYTRPLQAFEGALDNRTIFLFQGDDRDYILSRFALVHPQDLPVEVCGNQEGLETTDTTEGGWRVRSWTAHQMPRMYIEPHVPDRLEITPHIRLGLGLSWQDIGDLFRGALVGKQRPDAPLPELLEEIRNRAASDDKGALARAMHALVNEKIQPGQTALSLNLPASVSASAGEGNRIGVALALAEELGLEPDLIFTRPVELRGTSLDCPTTATFPYVMLRIVTPVGLAYLDYTEADHPFDTIPSRIGGSDGLLIPLSTDEPAQIIEIPKRETPILQEQYADVALDADGTVHGTLLLTLRGAFASVMRRVFRELPQDRLPLVYQTLAGEVFPGSRVLASEITGRENPEDDLAIKLAVEGGKLARRTPSGFAIPMSQQPLGLLQEYGSIPIRRQPLLLDLQAFRQDRTLIRLPEGLELRSLPEGFLTEGPFGAYRLESVSQNGALIIERTMRLPPIRVETDQYKSFRDFARDVDKAESAEILLGVSTPSLAPNPTT